MTGFEDDDQLDLGWLTEGADPRDEMPEDLADLHQHERTLLRCADRLEGLIRGDGVKLETLLDSYEGDSRPERARLAAEGIVALARVHGPAGDHIDDKAGPMAKAAGLCRSFLTTALGVAPISGSPADARWLGRLAYQTQMVLEEIAREKIAGGRGGGNRTDGGRGEDGPADGGDPESLIGRFGSSVIRRPDGRPIMDPSGEPRTYRTADDLFRNPAWTAAVGVDALTAARTHALLESARLREDHGNADVVVWEWLDEPAPVDLSGCDGLGLIGRAEACPVLDLWLYAEGAYSVITGRQGWGLFDVPGGIGEWRAAAETDRDPARNAAGLILDAFQVLSYDNDYGYGLRDLREEWYPGRLEEKEMQSRGDAMMERYRETYGEDYLETFGDDGHFDWDYRDYPDERPARNRERPLKPFDPDPRGLVDGLAEASGIGRFGLLDGGTFLDVTAGKWVDGYWRAYPTPGIPWQAYTPVSPDGLLRAWHPGNESGADAEQIAREREEWRAGLGGEEGERALLDSARDYCLTLSGDWTADEVYAAWSLFYTLPWALGMLLGRRGLKPMADDLVYRRVWEYLGALGDYIERSAP